MQWMLSNTFNKNEAGEMIWDVREYLEQVREDIQGELDRGTNLSPKNAALWELFDDIRANSGYQITSARDILWNSAHEECLFVWKDTALKNWYPYMKLTPAQETHYERNLANEAYEQGFGCVIYLDDLLLEDQIFIMEDDTDDHGDLQGIYELWRWKPSDLKFKHPVDELYETGLLTYVNAMDRVPEDWRKNHEL